MDRLDAGAIALPGIAQLLNIRVVERCSSTNSVLLAEGRAGILLAAEVQSAGRGRRGRRWHAPRGSGATFSLSRVIRRPVREHAGLSLVAGVASARALRALGVSQAALKWPNDIVADGGKLGGILVETRGSLAVIGIGINCRRDAALELRLRRRVASLDQYIAVERNLLIGRMAASLVEALDLFEARGLEPLRAQWERMDAHAGSRMRVRLANGRVLTGLSRGLDEGGGLCLQTRSGMRAVRSGRVLSARPA